MKTANIFGLTIALLCAAVLSTSPLFGQGKAFATQGVTEVGGSISFSSFTPVNNGKTGDVNTLFSFGPHIGYFVTNGFEIGINPGITLIPGVSIITPESGDATTVLQLFAYPAYNFRIEGSNATPFLEVPFGYTSMSSGNTKNSGFSWGVMGGVKTVVSGQVLLTFYVEYLLITLDSEKSTSTERTGMNYLSVGIAVGGFF
jgi:hypothetical protein